MLQTYKTKLTNKVKLTSDVYLLHFDLITPAELSFLPGQYLLLEIPQGEGYISRAYSILSSNKEKASFELLIKIIEGGVASRYLLTLTAGQIVEFKGPAGVFQLKASDICKKRIFFATGTGLAPIWSMMLSNLELLKNTEIILFWGLSTYANVYFFDELKNLAAQYTNFRFYICLSREQNLNVIPPENQKYFALGRVNQGFESYVNTNIDCDFYLCGSRGVIDSLKKYLLDKGIKPAALYYEKY